MRVILTGGGTGGHITPILALAHEIKLLQPHAHVIYIGERKGKYAEMIADNPDIDEVRTVYAGKFRRYYGESWLRRLVDVKTNFLNFRDLFYFLIGTLQALVLVKRLRPDAVLLKGGFVGVPTGLAAAFWRIPFITHDSDTLPGLANRLVARWARYHATGMPADFYTYPKENVRHVGILVSKNHVPVDERLQTQYKRDIGLPKDCLLVVITGGSGGAASINKAVKRLVPEWFKDFERLYVVHQVGKGKAGVYKGYQHERLQVHELLFPMYEYTGAADIIITRAGATAMAEFGAQARACIVIPNPMLTGGHQTVNAENLEKQGGAVVVKESSLSQDFSELDETVRNLLQDGKRRAQLGKKLQALTIPDAAHRTAVLLLEVAHENK